MIWKVLRFLLRIPPPAISKGQAVEIALQECQRRGWTWGKLYVVEKLRTWQVWINSDVKGSPFILVCQRTGKVLGVAWLPL